MRGSSSRPGLLSGSMIALKKRSTKLGVVAGFAVLFGILVAVAVRGGGSSEVAVAPPPSPTQPAIAAPTPPPPVTHDATIAREPEAKEDVEKPAPPRRVVHVVQKASPRHEASRPAVKHEPDPPVAKVAPEKAKDDCNPPYYFQGSKKISNRLPLRSRMTRTLVAVLIALSVPAFAGPSKEECVESHSKGQDAKEQGKLRSPASCS